MSPVRDLRAALTDHERDRATLHRAAVRVVELIAPTLHAAIRIRIFRHWFRTER